MQSMLEQNIMGYISGINFKSDEWSINSIKSDLKRMMGETPAVKINYQKDVIINEIKGTAKEIKKVNGIDIIFTDLDNNIKKISLSVE